MNSRLYDANYDVFERHAVTYLRISLRIHHHISGPGLIPAIQIATHRKVNFLTAVRLDWLACFQCALLRVQSTPPLM